VLAGGDSPFGRPVLGSMVMACNAMVSGLPVMGFAGRPGGPPPPDPAGGIPGGGARCPPGGP
jgi:hypothetical protein